MYSPKNSKKQSQKKQSPKYIKKNNNIKEKEKVYENKLNGDTYFINSILKCYHNYYVNYFHFIKQIQFQINMNSLIESNYQQINYIYQGKTKQIDFLYIGHVLSKKLYWINKFNKIFHNLYIKNNNIFDKYNLSKEFHEDFFENNYVELHHPTLIYFIIYLINMMDKKLKIIDVKDPITKISIIGIIKINYYDDFDLNKHFLNIY
jgi:hypothetical protein